MSNQVGMDFLANILGPLFDRGAESIGSEIGCLGLLLLFVVAAILAVGLTAFISWAGFV